MKNIGKIVLMTLVIAFSLSRVSHADHKELSIGLIPEMNVFKQMARFKPLAE